MSASSCSKENPQQASPYKDNQGDFSDHRNSRKYPGRQHLNNLLMMLCFTYVIGLAILFLLSKRFAGKALKPIVHVNDTIRQIRSGTCVRRVIVHQAAAP